MEHSRHWTAMNAFCRIAAAVVWARANVSGATPAAL
jgi:hypothetical protein